MSSRFPVILPRVDWSANHQRVLDRMAQHPEVRDRMLSAVDREDMPREERIYIPQPQRTEDARLAQMATQAPRIPWDEFVAEHFKWLPGEHLAIIGPTGQGKTNLLVNLVPFHPYTVIFATKPRDKTIDQFIDQGYLKMRYWQSIDADQFPKRVLWPNAEKLGAIVEQQRVFHDAFDKIYREGGWTVVIDELWYMVNVLKLETDIRIYLLQARAMDISLAVATQRPSRVPLEVYDQSTHLFFFRDNDERNLERLSGVNKRSAALIRSVVSNLETHQVLYINTRTGEMLRTRAPKVS